MVSGTKLYMKCSGLRMAWAGNCMLNFFCDIHKNWNFWTKSRFFRGQVWPDLWQRMANVCYYCKLNTMLMCEIM